MRSARDVNNSLVEVYQPEQDQLKESQWFYMVTCRNHDAVARSPARDCPGCCIGVDHNRQVI